MSSKFFWRFAPAVLLTACALPQAPLAPPAQPPGLADEAQARAALGLPPDQQVYPGGNSYRVQAVTELAVTGTIADSQVSGFEKDRLADGNLATEWASGGYQNATAWAGVQLSAIHSIASVALKTGPTAPGASYDIQVSDDGMNWRTVLSNQTNTSWNLETKPMLSGTTGRYVRIFWRNSATSPAPRFSIFELVVNGEGTGSATPAPLPSSTPPPTSGPAGVIGTRVDSEAAGFPKERLIDQDPGTQWVNGGYQNPTSWATLELASRMAIASIQLKTGPTPAGSSYDIQVSDDGASWTTRLANQTNTTWQMETKTLPSGSAGKFVRIFWRNSATSPAPHFSIFEAKVNGTTTSSSPSPTPTPSPTPSSGTGGTSQYYPDLAAIPPDNLWMETGTIKKLHFSNAIPNLGGGPFQVRSRNDSTNEVTYATQEILDGSGRIVESRTVGTFEYHPEHDHTHLDGVARYQLRTGSPTGTVVRTSTKVSFCMMDSYPYRAPAPPSSYKDCTLTLQGISVNWADLYASNLPGQDLDVTTLPAGEYYLVTTTDPFGQFIDVSRSNNVAWVKIFLDPAQGTVNRLGASQ